MYLSEEVVIKVVLLLVCLRRHEVRVQLVSQVVTLVERHSWKSSFFFSKFTLLDIDFDEVKVGCISISGKVVEIEKKEGKTRSGFLLQEE